jgi:hypothetical protein
MTIVMYDSINLDQFPDDPEAVAGYVGGNWPTYNDLVAKFPNAHHLSIAVNQTQRARCLDIEPGNCGPEDGPGWFKAYGDDSDGPIVIYCGASASSAVINAMASAGISRNQYLLWSAHYTYSEHICGGGACDYPKADGTQWTDKAMGRNLDQSLVGDVFFQRAPAPSPQPDDGAELFAVLKADGRLETFAQKQSGEVLHAYQTATDGGWEGSEPGRAAKWYALGNPGQ